MGWTTERAMIIAMLAVALFLGLFLLGCGEHRQLKSEYAATTEHLDSIRYSDATNAEALTKDHFVAGEVPAIRIQGCGGRRVRFLLVESSTGKLITGKTHNVAEGRTLYWPFPHLPEGSYYVVLKVPGLIRKETCTFTVSR